MVHSPDSVGVYRCWWYCPGIALLALALSVLFFAPRLWLMTDVVPGSFQWSRATTYLLQCEQPMRRDIEPAMTWRLLPPWIAHALHLGGKWPLTIPWVGVAAATTYVAVLLRRRREDHRFVLGGTLLFATTSAVLVPTGWLGLNDAWVWLGLLSVAFSRHAWATPIACLLCPWVDERFIIGFPLAWLVGRLDIGEPLFGKPALKALWLLPYAALRLSLAQQDPVATATLGHFIRNQIHESLQLLPLVPLGWWMGLRAAWGAAAWAIWEQKGKSGQLLLATLLATMVVSWLVASDLSRSVAVVIPLVLAGIFALARTHPLNAPRIVLGVGIVNLLIPACHVVFRNIDPINPLPVELFRLLR